MKIYLDNGATTKVAKEVIEVMLPYFYEQYGNASSLHSYGREAREAVEEARKIIADSIGANSGEIVFTSGGTESDNFAIRGYAFANKDKGNHIITTRIEHPAVLNTCKELEKQGFEVTYLDVDEDGFVDIEQLKKSITKKTILVSIIHGNNVIGTIQDIENIGKVCEENNIALHTDAVQSYTKFDIDVENMNICLLSASSHKIHGPKGAGFLYIKQGTKMLSQNTGGSHEFKLRAGTENVPGIVGMAKAVEIADNKYVQEMQKLRDYLIEGLLKIPYTILNGSIEKRLCNNVNISFKHVEGESLLMHLDLEGISVSTGSACSSKTLEPSYVLLALGQKIEDAHGSIRFTLSKYITKKQIDYTIKKVKDIVDKLRKISPLVK